MISLRHALQSRRQRHADLILAVLAADDGGRYAPEIAETAELPAGSFYPVLARLEREGLITSGWAEGPSPRRRLYRITPAGRIAAAAQEGQ